MKYNDTIFHRIAITALVEQVRHEKFQRARQFGIELFEVANLFFVRWVPCGRMNGKPSFQKPFDQPPRNEAGGTGYKNRFFLS